MKQTAALKITTPSERELVMTRDFATPRGIAVRRPDKTRPGAAVAPGPPGGRCRSARSICALAGSTVTYGAMRWPGNGMGGTFKEIVRPSRLVATRRMRTTGRAAETLGDHGARRDARQDSLGTTVRYASREARDAAMKMGATKGWRRATTGWTSLLTA